jgi:NADH:ubiquinone oxidoreductase subunit 2 (subunit N)
MNYEFYITQTYHLKDLFFSAEILIGSSILQLTFYVICVSYIRRNGFVVLNQQIYYVGFLILFLASFLILNEDLLYQNLSNINDYLSFFSKLVICITSLFFILIITVFSKEELMKHNFEYVVLILISVLGSLLLCSSNDFITTYLSMELQSVAFYIMAAFKKNSNYSIESGLKYFIVGSFASAFFLFGSSFIYGYTGSVNFNDFNFFLNISKNYSVYNNFTELTEIAVNSLNYLVKSMSENSDYNFYVILITEIYDIDNIAYVLQNNYDCLKYFFSCFSLAYFSTEMTFPDWFLLENSIDFTCISDTAIPVTANEDMARLLPVLTDILDLPFIALSGFNEFLLNEYLLPIFYEGKNDFWNFFYNCSFDSCNSTFIYFKSMSEFCKASEFIDAPFYYVIIDNSAFDVQIIYIGFMLICLSLLIKLAVAPFHFWSLDVYEGSPNSSTFFFAVIPKIGFFVLLTRICYSGFYELLDEWRFYFLILAVVSIFVGSLGGLEQRKLKSLLAYSSISHTGYLLLSFSTNLTEGIPTMIYYIVIFMLSGLGFWSIYMFLNLKTKTSYYNKQNKELGDLVLLFKPNPILAISLTIILFSIAGIPPLVGFFAKFNIFLSVLTVSAYVIALISILLSVVSTFYYIRIIKIIYFENVLTGKLYNAISTNKALIISFLLLSIILLSVYPIVLYMAAYKAVLLF